MKKLALKMMFSLIPIVTSVALVCDERIELAEGEVESFMKEFQGEYKYEVEGIGGSYCDCSLNCFGLFVGIKGQYRVPEARKMLLEITNQFVERINKNKELLIYIPGHRCTLNNLILSISIDKKNKSSNEEFVSQALGGDVFSYLYREKKTLRSKTIHEETYEEAMEKINEI